MVDDDKPPGSDPPRPTTDPHAETAAGGAAADDPIWSILGVGVGDRVADKYRVVRRVGRGGMGAVFEAEHESIKRPVALKVLRAELAADPMQAARFQREAQSATQVRHPNIVDILDFGVHDGRPFMVMELLEGETLGAVMRREGPMSMARAVELVAPVLKGLAAAHRKGIVHRDIKPENIFLAQSDDEPPTAKILDFGVAKVEDPESERLTGSRVALGTVAYMAPEQIRASRDAGEAADQYSAAVMLYEALTGRLPHEATSYNEMVVAKVTSPAHDLAAARPDLPTEACAVVMRALADAPEDRHGSVSDFREALEALPTLSDAPPRVAPVDELAATAESDGQGVAGVMPAPSRPGSPSESGASAGTSPSTEGAISPRAWWHTRRERWRGPEPSTGGALRPRAWWPYALVGVAAALVGAFVTLQGGDDADPLVGDPPPAVLDASTPEGPLPAILRADGNDMVRLTTNPATQPVHDGALSSDGAFLAYLDGAGIHIREIASGNMGHFALTPGSLPVAVTALPGDNQRWLVSEEDADGTTHIGSFTTLTREVRRLVGPGVSDPAGAPDGARIAYLAAAGVTLMATEGGSTVIIGARREDENLSTPAWSPDGRFVVWARRRGAATPEVVLVAADSGGEDEPSVVFEDPNLTVTETCLVWLPEGYLAYSARTELAEGDRTELHAVALDGDPPVAGGVPFELSSCRFDSCYLVSASADGRRLLVEGWDTELDVMAIDLTSAGTNGGTRASPTVRPRSP